MEAKKIRIVTYFVGYLRLDLNLYICIAGLLVASTALCNASCSNYKNMSMYNGRRTAYYKTELEDTNICDNGKYNGGDWIRFEHPTGNRLNEGCVALGRCGASYTLYLKDTHPKSVGVEVIGAICISYLDECCYDDFETKVKLCQNSWGTQFYVYQPAHLPICAGYCTEPREPCPSGQTWDYNRDRCIANEKPVLESPQSFWLPVNTPLTYNLTFSDPDGDKVRLGISDISPDGFILYYYGTLLITASAKSASFKIQLKDDRQGSSFYDIEVQRWDQASCSCKNGGTCVQESVTVAPVCRCVEPFGGALCDAMSSSSTTPSTTTTSTTVSSTSSTTPSTTTPSTTTPSTTTASTTTPSTTTPSTTTPSTTTPSTTTPSTTTPSTTSTTKSTTTSTTPTTTPTTTTKPTTTTEKTTTKSTTTTKEPTPSTKQPTPKSTTIPTTTTSTKSSQPSAVSTSTTLFPHSTTLPSGKIWDTWGPFTPCTKTCDFGLHSRRRTCPTDSCEGKDMETQLCNKFNCKEDNNNPNTDDGQGVVYVDLGGGEGTIKKLYTPQADVNETTLMDRWLHSLEQRINEVCHMYPGQCCKPLAPTRDTETPFLGPNDVEVATGYPKIDENGHIVLKVQVRKDKEVPPHCMPPQDGQRWRLPRDILEQAIESPGVQVVLKDADIDIVGVSGPPDREGLSRGAIIGISVAGALVVLVVLISVVVCRIHKSRRQSKKEEEKQQQNQGNEGEYEDPDELLEGQNVYAAQSTRRFPPRIPKRNHTKAPTGNGVQYINYQSEDPSKHQSQPNVENPADGVANGDYVDMTGQGRRPGQGHQPVGGHAMYQSLEVNGQPSAPSEYARLS